MSGESHTSSALTHCENCGTPLNGPYCHQCGQHAIDYRRSFHHLTHDVLENLFHFDGKLLVSVAWLLAKPGKLTAEYNAGRRQSQVPPLRFYIFVTVLFFLGLHLLNHGHLIPINEQAVDMMSREVTKSMETQGTLTTAQQRRLAELIEAASEKKHGELDAKELDAIIRQVRTESAATAGAPPPKGRVHTNVHLDETTATGRALKKKLAAGELSFVAVIEAIEHRVPTLLLLGMPLLALWMKLFYRTCGRYYIEHLVFSLHLHTWLFLAIMIGSGYLDLASLGPAWLSSLAGWALFGWMVWYGIAAFRAVYGQSWKLTVAKTAGLGVLYVLTLAGLEIGLVSLTLMWLAYS